MRENNDLSYENSSDRQVYEYRLIINGIPIQDEYYDNTNDDTISDLESHEVARPDELHRAGTAVHEMRGYLPITGSEK
jgi:hypothetical protein